jgi:hypothetical protein
MSFGTGISGGLPLVLVTELIVATIYPFYDLSLH